MLSRRQSHSLFAFSVDLDFWPHAEGQEAGVTVSMNDRTRLNLGIVGLLSSNCSRDAIVPHLRFEGITESAEHEDPDTVAVEVPSEWLYQRMMLEIKAFNASHYSFSAGPAKHQSLMRTVAYAPAQLLQPIFTGALLGVYASMNESLGGQHACLTSRNYQGQSNFIS